MKDEEIIEKWKYWIQEFAINDIKKALEKDALEVGLIILTLLSIECLSAYYLGQSDSSPGTFEKFMKMYFPPEYAKYAGKIYFSLRNGLIHSYVPNKLKIDSREIYPFVMVGKKGEPHLTPCKPKHNFPVYFNRVQFAEDFLEAWGKFVNDIDGNAELQKKLISRAQKGFLVVDNINKFVRP